MGKRVAKASKVPPLCEERKGKVDIGNQLVSHIARNKTHFLSLDQGQFAGDFLEQKL